MISQYILGFMAGGLSLLAPCVLPLLPLIVTSSLRNSKWGPPLSALGLTLSFTLFGILSTTFASVFDPDVIRNFGAWILVIVGILFIVPSMKLLSSASFQKIGNMGALLQTKIIHSGAKGEFLGGALLGLIWSPCTGPTLALAIGLASQAQNLTHASLVFFFFGLGAGISLVVFGLLVQKFRFVRNFLIKFGKLMNIIAGTLSLTIGILILTGLEGEFQELLLKFIPEWLTNLTVSI